MTKIIFTCNACFNSNSRGLDDGKCKACHDARCRALTSEEIAALREFAGEYGRRWKGVLSDLYWYNARLFYRRGNYNDSTPGSLLHGLRNSHGPSWLDRFKLPKGE